MVAGLEEPTTGTITLGDEDITRLKPYRRPVNTVFQSYALFPHLTIADNVAFGLKRQGRKDVDAQGRARCSTLVELEPLGQARPAQLSGGQQQRVALARALINQPQVLLLDEPLGALDLKLRRQMQLELKRIQTEVGLTFVHVTHDQEEAMTMADTVAVMNEGRIEQLGRPRSCTSARDDLRGQLPRPVQPGRAARSPRPAATCWTSTSTGTRLVADTARARGRRAARSGSAYVPRRSTSPRPARTTAGVNTLPDGVVSDVSFVGVSTQYLVRMPWGQELTVFEQNTGARERFRAGDKVDLHWRPRAHLPPRRLAGRLGRASSRRTRERRRAHLPAGPAEAGSRGRPDPEGQKRGWAGYLLLLPGALWLLLFFVVPDRHPGRHQPLRPVGLAAARLPDDRALAELRRRAAATTGRSSCGRWSTRCSPPLACIVLGFPLAYAIAFKAGRWKNLMLVAVIAPFFTSFLVRTLSWQHILGDNEPLVSLLRTLHVLGADGLPAGDAVRGGHRADLQLPAVHGAAAVRLAGEDRPAADRGRADLYASPVTTFRTVTLPLAMPGLVAGHAADLHPGRRRLHQLRAAGQPADPDDRQRDPGPLRGRRLPDGRVAVGDADGRDRAAGLPLRTPRRHRGARVNTCLALARRPRSCSSSACWCCSTCSCRSSSSS